MVLALASIPSIDLQCDYLGRNGTMVAASSGLPMWCFGVGEHYTSSACFVAVGVLQDMRSACGIHWDR